MEDTLLVSIDQKNKHRRISKVVETTKRLNKIAEHRQNATITSARERIAYDISTTTDCSTNE